MALILDEDQQMIKETAREFVQENSPITRVRELRDSNDADGFSRELWKEMAELGWAGIVIPEEYGGQGLGWMELGVILEECGRTLVPEPFVSTVLLGSTALLLGENETAKKDLLPAVCAGERLLALAFQETAHFHPFAIETRAEAANGRYTLNGKKVFVFDGHVADSLIVAARSAGKSGERDGITLFVVDAKAAGVSIQRTNMLDSRNAAEVTLKNVEVETSAVLGQPGQGGELLEAVLDRAAIGLAALMLGGALEAFDRTIAYLKERKQFNVPIGSFQALKHRASRMFCALEFSKSIVLGALTALDAGDANVAKFASTAKAQLSDTFALVAKEAVQMHGGIGVTDECDIGFYLKRAKVAGKTFGDASYHRERFARLEGY